jgi:hypothetical protein
MSKSPTRSMARVMQEKPAKAMAETKAKRRTNRRAPRRTRKYRPYKTRRSTSMRQIRTSSAAMSQIGRYGTNTTAQHRTYSPKMMAARTRMSAIAA